MNEIAFLESINDIDPELLTEPTERKKPGSVKLRFLMIAAAVLLLLGGGTAYAIAGGQALAGHISLRKTQGIDEQGFEAKVKLPIVQWSEFKGEIKDAGEIIAEQYATYVPEPPESSFIKVPGLYAREFGSVEEAVAYIGLSGLKPPTFPFTTESWGVSAFGDEQGNVSNVILYANHVQSQEIVAQLRVTILTENAAESEYVTGGVWTYAYPRDVRFVNHTTPGGNECRIAELHPLYECNYIGIAGYVADGSALYELHLGSVPKARYEQALQILCDWADALDAS